MAKFPISLLPAPLRASFSSSPARRARNIEMDDGTTFRRCSQSRSLRTMTLSWYMTPEQVQVFDGFMEYTCDRGIGEFDISIGGEEITVRPISRPSYSPAGAGWNIALDVVTAGEAAVIPSPSSSIPEWPFSFTFERSGFTLRGGDFAMSDIESGGLDSRNRFRSRVYKYTGRMTMSPTDRDAFWQFYRNTLINGASWFVAPFYSAKSNGRKKARFTEEPSEAANGAWFAIQMELETVDLPILTYNEYQESFPLENIYVLPGYVEDGYTGDRVIQ